MAVLLLGVAGECRVFGAASTRAWPWRLGGGGAVRVAEARRVAVDGPAAAAVDAVAGGG